MALNKFFFTKIIVCISILIPIVFIGCHKEREPVSHTNNKPIIDSITADKKILAVKSSVTLKCYAKDKDGDKLTITWSAKRGTFVNGNIGSEIKWIASIKAGLDTIYVMVSDGKEISYGKIIFTIGTVPKIPVLYQPFNNSNEISLSHQLIWKKVKDAENYTIQVSTGESFSKILIAKSKIVNNMYTLKGLQIDTRYFWRVRSINIFGHSNWSSVFSFHTVAPPLAPKLIYPSQLQIDVSLNSKFVWQKIGNAGMYSLQLSTDSSFSKPVYTKDGLTDTTLQVPELNYFEKYFWRVKAVNQYGSSSWANIKSFETMGTAPQITTVVVPQNGSTKTPLSIIMRWNPIDKALSYAIQISEDSTFTKVIVDQNNIVETKYNVSDLKNTKKYYWRIKANNIYGASDWTVTNSFTTLLPPPASSFPLEGAEDVSPSPTLIWNQVDQAESYGLQISEDSSFTKIIVDEDKIDTTFKDISGLNTFTKYYWRVNAVNDIGQSEWSSINTFDVTAYYYKGFNFGNQAVYNPVYIVLNGGFDMIQVGNKRNLKDFPFSNALKNIWKNISDPFGPINRYGWWNFISDQVLPLSLDKKNGQFWPNYTLHLIGGGMDYAQLKEWYEYHKYPIPGWLSAFTVMSYHFVNEVMENGTHVGDDVDPIADLYLFDIGGILLFTSENVKKFFSEELNLADWSQQPSFSLRNGELHNNGQFFSVKWKFPFSDSWHAFYYFGTNGVGGLSYKFKDGTAISVGAGLAASDLILLDEKTNKKTLGLVGNFGVFYDKNNSLLASLSVTIKTDYMINVNIYPGVIKLFGISPGLWGAYSQDGNIIGGITFSWLPFGLANSIK